MSNLAESLQPLTCFSSPLRSPQSHSSGKISTPSSSRSQQVRAPITLALASTLSTTIQLSSAALKDFVSLTYGLNHKQRLGCGALCILLTLWLTHSHPSLLPSRFFCLTCVYTHSKEVLGLHSRGVYIL